MKMQKENFDSAFLKHQKHIIKLEHDHDDFEQYGYRLRVRLEDMPVDKEKTAGKVFSKSENSLKEACPNLSGNCMNHKTNKTCHSVKVRFTSFKHRTLIYRNKN